MLGCAHHQMEAGKEHKIHENFSAKPINALSLSWLLSALEIQRADFLNSVYFRWSLKCTLGYQRLDRWRLTEGKKGFKTWFGFALRRWGLARPRLATIKLFVNPRVNIRLNSSKKNCIQKIGPKSLHGRGTRLWQSPLYNYSRCFTHCSTEKSIKYHTTAPDVHFRTSI